MQNKTLIAAARLILTELVIQCSEKEQIFFKKMYSHQNSTLSITDIVDNLDPSKLDTAITQCENTIRKNAQIDKSII